MRKSLFEGWTREQQCFGPMEDGQGRYCALGWLSYKRASHEELSRIYHDVGTALIERFPELKVRAENGLLSPGGAIAWASDWLHLDPNIFLSLDRESIAREEAREVVEMAETQSV